MGIGISLGFLLTYILKKVTGDLTCASFWFVSFGFPLVTIALQSFNLYFVFPYETPKYWLAKGDRERARELI